MVGAVELAEMAPLQLVVVEVQRRVRGTQALGQAAGDRAWGKGGTLAWGADRPAAEVVAVALAPALGTAREQALVLRRRQHSPLLTLFLLLLK